MDTRSTHWRSVGIRGGLRGDRGRRYRRCRQVDRETPRPQPRAAVRGTGRRAECCAYHRLGETTGAWVIAMPRADRSLRAECGGAGGRLAVDAALSDLIDTASAL